MHKKFLTYLTFAVILFIHFQVSAQGLIYQAARSQNPDEVEVSCGSYSYLQNMNRKAPGVLKAFDTKMEQIQQIVRNQGQRSSEKVYYIPVVFHIVYNDSTENLPDSVIENQLKILNESFRRQNADTVNLRTEFLNLVGDARIEFKLATTDPDGNPSNGITRTFSNIQHFGGILPYGQGQNAQIQQWVNDSLFYNFFRITQDSLGGKTEWDREKYLNVWIGDLRILEPQIQNFEELVFFGLTTPPIGFPNFPDSLYGNFVPQANGVLMHYVNIAGNNPNQFSGGYSVYNGVTNTGKTLVHEVGHYLGLRHIWGDGDCTMDDYVDDTPRANNPSQYNCNMLNNNCLDTINGADLKNMVENYMDYSSGPCQNSFTLGQIEIMRYVLENFRSNVFTTGVVENNFETSVRIFPNPTNDAVTIALGSEYKKVDIRVLNATGILVHQQTIFNTGSITQAIPGQAGIYFIHVVSESNSAVWKVIKQ